MIQNGSFTTSIAKSMTKAGRLFRSALMRAATRTKLIWRRPIDHNRYEIDGGEIQIAINPAQIPAM